MIRGFLNLIIYETQAYFNPFPLTCFKCLSRINKSKIIKGQHRKCREAFNRNI